MEQRDDCFQAQLGERRMWLVCHRSQFNRISRSLAPKSEKSKVTGERRVRRPECDGSDRARHNELERCVPFTSHLSPFTALHYSRQDFAKLRPHTAEAHSFSRAI